MPLQSRFPKKGPPFPSHVYSSSSSQRSSPIFKFEKAFEEFFLNERDYKETLRRHNYRKPRRKASPSEQVGLISIYDSKEEKHKDNLQEQEVPSHQEEPTQEQTLEKVHIPNKKCTKRTNWQAMVSNMRGKKVQTHHDDEVMYIFTPTKQSYNNNLNNILIRTSFGEEERT